MTTIAWIGVSSILAGCVGAMLRGGADPAARREIGSRVDVDEHAADPFVATREIARLEFRAGNHYAALRASARHLRHAQMELAVARIHGDAASIRRAQRQRQSAVALQIEIGRRLNRPDLTVATAADARRPRRFGRAIRRGLQHGARVSEPDQQTLSHALRAPRVQARLAAAGTQQPDLSPRQWRRAGADGVSLRRRAMQQAFRDEDLDAAATHAAGITKHDPLDVAGQLALLAAEDHARGKLAGSRGDLMRVQLRAGSLQALALAQRLDEDHPKVTSIALSRLRELVAAELVGDARLLAATLTWLDGDGARLRDQLAAMASLAAGDARRYAAWASAHDGERSRALARFSAALESNAPADVAAIARAARLRNVGDLETGRASFVAAADLWATKNDTTVSKQLRRKAERHLMRHDALSRAVYAACDAGKLDRTACDELETEAFETLYDGDAASSEFLEQLPIDETFDPSWLSSARYRGVEGLRSLRPHLGRYTATRVGFTPAYEEAVVFTELANRDVDAARRSLQNARLVSDEARAIATLVVRDLEEDAVPIGDALASVGGPDPIVALLDGPRTGYTEATVQKWYAGPGRVRQYARARGLLAAGMAARGAPLLQALVDELGTDAPSALRRDLAVATAMTGDSARTKTMVAALDKTGADRLHVDVLRGHIAEVEKRFDDAARAYGRAVVRRPDDTALFTAWIRTLARAKTTTPSATTVLAALRDTDLYGYGGLLDGKSFGASDGRSVLHAVLAHSDPSRAWALGRRGAGIETIATLAVGHVDAQIGEATNTRDARAWARRGLDYVRAAPTRSSHRLAEVYLLWLLGEADSAVDVALRDTDDGNSPMTPDSLPVLLAPARKRGAIDDHTALTLWRIARRFARADDPSLAELLAPFQGEPEVAAALCTHYTLADAFAEAGPLCARVVREGIGDATAWVNAAFLIVAHPKTIDLDGASVFEARNRPPGLDNDGTWHLNVSVWLGNQGRAKAAAAAKLRALAAGYHPGEPTTEDLPQLPYRGATARAQARDTSGNRITSNAAFAVYALRGGETKAARLYADAAVRWASKDDNDALEAAFFARHAAPLVADDLEAGRLAAPALNAIIDATAGYDGLLTLYPDSVFVGALWLENQTAGDKAHGLADDLVRRYPQNHLVLRTALPVLIEHGETRRVKKLFAAARRDGPHDHYLDAAPLPVEITGAHPELPTWARRPDAFRRRLASITDAEIAALAPIRRTDSATDVEAFVPSGLPAMDTTPVGVKIADDLRVGVVAEARASRCELEECARLTIEGMGEARYTPLWSKRIETAIGPGIEIMLQRGELLGALTVVPIGGHTFSTMAFGRAADLERALPAVALARRTIRPMDGVIAANRAQQLRGLGGKPPSPAMRIGARTELAESKARGCGIPDTLAAVPNEAARGELLVDLFLTTVDAAARRRVVACVEPTNPSAARLAIVALIDMDPVVHRFGREAVAAHPDTAWRDAAVLDEPGLQISTQSFAVGAKPRPPRGRLEVLLALPEARQRAAWTELLESADENQRAIALAAAALTRRPWMTAAIRRRLPSLSGDDAAVAKATLAEEPRPSVPSGLTPRTAQALRTRPLTALLPGSDWAYARLADPALFRATTDQLVRRLKVEGARGAVVTRGLIAVWNEALGLLHKGSGVRLDRPVECAARGLDKHYVCTARLDDVRRVRTKLAEGPQISGLRLPLSLSTTGSIAPPLVTGLPFLLHAVFDRRRDDAKGKGKPTSKAKDEPPPRTIRTDTARWSTTVGGHACQAVSTLEVRTDGVVETTELQAIVGDRLFVFSDLETAREVLLHKAGSPSLADSGEFTRLIAHWSSGAAVQAVAMAEAATFLDAGIAVEAAIDGDGLSFRMVTDLDEPAVANQRLYALMPPGATAQLWLASSLGRSDEFPAMHEVAELGKLPPAWLLGGSALGFSWYPKPRQRLWDHWLAVLPDDSTGRAVLRRRRIRARAGRITNAKNLWVTARDGALIVSNARDLVERARATKPETVANASPRMATGRVQIGRTHALMRWLPLAQTDEGIRESTRMALGLIEGASFDATTADRRLEITGRVSVALREASTHLDVVDGWLANNQMRNATRLPRRVSDRELKGEMTYVLRVDDAARFASHGVIPSERNAVEIASPTEVRLKVTAPKTRAPAALGDGQRKRLLANTNEYQIDDPRIRRLARQLVSDGTKPTQAAETIARWVNTKVAYRLNPASVPATEVLESRTGDCTEHTTLTVSLLRAASVPAEERLGMVVSGGQLVAHAWVAYHDGEQWREIDPTSDTLEVTAGHIELSVAEVVGLLSMGRLSVHSIHSAPAP